MAVPVDAIQITQEVSSPPRPESEGRASIKVLELQPVADWDSKLFKLKTGKPHFGLQICMVGYANEEV